MKKTSFRLGAGLLIVGVAYALFWWKMADRLEHQVQIFMKDMRNKGCEVSYEAFQTGGFPFKLYGVLKNPSLTQRDIGLATFKTEGKLYIGSSLFKSDALLVSSEGKSRITYTFDKPEHSVSLSAGAMTGKVSIWGQGLNRYAQLNLTEVDLEASSVHAYAESIDLKNFEVEEPARLKISFEARQISPGVKFSPPFDQKIGLIRLTARFDLEKALSFSSIPDLLKALSHEGGSFEIEKAEIDWGALTLNANGTLTLDEQRQPIASFGATVRGLDQTLDGLAKERLIRPQIAQIAKLALSALKEPSSLPNAPPCHKVSFSLQNGEFSVGAIPLYRFSPIQWDKK